jgi:GDP-4-dehydro-6-deoxy-D-mannose reductase
LEANALGTLSVLTGCAAVGVGRVLVVTSADVYGSTTEADLPLTEDAPLRPVSPYAASKAAAEMLCVQAHLGWGVDVIRARAFNHIGPGQSPAFAAPAFASRIVDAERSGTGVIRVGNLLARRDITDVRDVVRAYRSLMESATAGEAYNVCTGADVAMSDIIDLLISLANCPLQIEHDPDLDRPVDVPARRGDPAKINAATGWQPRIPFEQSVCDVLADVRTRRADAATHRQRER